MKQFKFFAVALAALTMFSCSKENIETPPSNAPGEKASLTIAVTGEGNLKSGSKAIGGAGATDVTVNDYIVFLFRAGGGLDCPAQYKVGNTASTITGTTAAKKAYVVANTGAVAGGKFANVQSETDLKAVVGDLMASANTASQTATNLWMSGSDDITYGTADATKGTVTVTLAFVGAKIELIVKDNRTAMTGGTTTIVDKEVVLLFAGKEGKFFGENQAEQTAFYSGDVNYPSPTASEASSALTDAVAVPFTANAGGTVFNHFYTFGNDGAPTPTILAIKSTQTAGGASKTIYYPVQFTATDAGFTIVPGNSYKVTLTLKGDVGAGGGGGTIDPEEPVVSAEITVDITPAEWTPNVVNKVFN